MDQFYSNFGRACGSKGIECQIAETRWLELKKEYFNKCDWQETIVKCIYYASDNNKKMINTNRLRNWLRKAVQFSNKPTSIEKKKIKIELKPSPIDVALEPIIAGKNLAGFKPKSVDEIMQGLSNMAAGKQMSQPSYVENLQARAEEGDRRAKHLLRGI